MTVTPCGSFRNICKKRCQVLAPLLKRLLVVDVQRDRVELGEGHAVVIDHLAQILHLALVSGDVRLVGLGGREEESCLLLSEDAVTAGVDDADDGDSCECSVMTVEHNDLLG